MGMMINGKLVDNWLDEEIDGGEFKRMESTFRHWITVDGRAGPSGNAGFKAEPGRYHLYVSGSCPWAHRTIIFRRLKQLEDVISMSVVIPEMLQGGWRFSESGEFADQLYGSEFLHELYTRSDRGFTGQITVPVLWDRMNEVIVNNESSEIIRMLNSAFNAFTPVQDDYYPEALRAQIDAINEPVYDNINNGVYRCGFAKTQVAYEDAYDRLFNEIDRVEAILDRQRYLVGDTLTEADWRLFTTLVRFDAVYYGHFKCNRKRIIDYPNLSNFTRELYQVPGIGDTVNIGHIKRHYYGSHLDINPTQIVPKGPELDFTAPHNRASKFTGKF